MQSHELSDLLGTTLGTSTQLPVGGFALMSNQIVLDPKPSGTDTGNILMWYIPEYAPPANDQALVFPALAFGWDEWVVLDASIQIRMKAMMPSDDLMAERDQLEQKLMHQAHNRDVGAPPRVRDSGWGGRGASGTRGQFAIK